MTIPTLMNCPHSEDGWCLDCVKTLDLEKNKRITELEKQIRFLKQQLRDMNRDFQESMRDSAAEQRWKDIQGEDYGGY